MVDSGRHRDAEKLACLVDDRERLTVAGVAPFLVALEPGPREARRHRLWDAREAQQVGIVEHRFDRDEMPLAERL